MFFKKACLMMAFCLCSNSLMASMTISGTRIIFPGDQKEVSVRTNNKGNTPPLVQVWVDDGKTNSDVNNMKVPFIVTPPIYRVEPGRGQTVRLIYNGMALPQDRESVFWFNMLEIPASKPEEKAVSDNKNKLDLAFRTRIKIFYRPKALTSSNVSEVSKLQWTLIDNPSKGRGVKVVNTTPYYMSFDGVSLKSAGKNYELNIDMLSPFTSYEVFTKSKLAAGAPVQNINLRLINDYGAVVQEVLSNKKGQGWQINQNTNSQN